MPTRGIFGGDIPVSNKLYTMTARTTKPRRLCPRTLQFILQFPETATVVGHQAYDHCGVSAIPEIIRLDADDAAAVTMTMMTTTTTSHATIRYNHYTDYYDCHYDCHYDEHQENNNRRQNDILTKHVMPGSLTTISCTNTKSPSSAFENPVCWDVVHQPSISSTSTGRHDPSIPKPGASNFVSNA